MCSSVQYIDHNLPVIDIILLGYKYRGKDESSKGTEALGLPRNTKHESNTAKQLLQSHMKTQRDAGGSFPPCRRRYTLSISDRQSSNTLATFVF